MLPLPVGLLGPGQTWDVDESTCETMSTGADDCHVGLQAASLRDRYRYGFIDERPAIGSLDETFGVKMVQIGGKNDHAMSFRMRGETSFGKLMRAWCSHHGVPLEKLCFSMYEDGCFDRELKPEDYPWGDSVTPIIIRITPRSPKAVKVESLGEPSDVPMPKFDARDELDLDLAVESEMDDSTDEATPLQNPTWY